MKLAQILIISWWFSKLALSALNHGKDISPEPQKYNFVTTLATIAISASVLYIGGFWDCLLK